MTASLLPFCQMIQPYLRHVGFAQEQPPAMEAILRSILESTDVSSIFTRIDSCGSVIMVLSQKDSKLTIDVLNTDALISTTYKSPPEKSIEEGSLHIGGSKWDQMADEANARLARQLNLYVEIEKIRIQYDFRALKESLRISWDQYLSQRESIYATVYWRMYDEDLFNMYRDSFYDARARPGA